jgi:hypothetical protein
MAEYNALQVPGLGRDSDGIEVLRAAVIDGGLHVTLRRAFNDPQAWGVLLADVARQVARVYQEQGERSQDETIASIRKAFDQQIKIPSNAGLINPVS